MFVHPNCLGALKFRGYSQASVVDVVWLFSLKFWDSEITYIIRLFCFPFEGPWQAMVSPRLCSVHFAGSCRWFLHVCAFVFATIIHHLHCRTPLLSVYPLSSFLSWSPPKFGGVLCGWTHPDMFFLILFCPQLLVLLCPRGHLSVLSSITFQFQTTQQKYHVISCNCKHGVLSFVFGNYKHGVLSFVFGNYKHGVWGFVFEIFNFHPFSSLKSEFWSFPCLLQANAGGSWHQRWLCEAGRCDILGGMGVPMRC